MGSPTVFTPESNNIANIDQGTYTARYNIDWLIYYEVFQYVNTAIAREKELKDRNRARKIALIESINPTWEGLSLRWDVATPEKQIPAG